MIADYTSQLWLLIGAFVIGLGLPFFAVLVLDGIVALFRNMGVRALASAIAMTVVVGGGGFALWTVGTDQVLAVAGGIDFAADTRSLMQTLLIFSVPVAVFAFVVRTIWALSRTEPTY